MNNEQMILNLDDEYMVVQDNALVMGKYDFSAMEQKLFLILISTIKKEDKNVSKTIFKIKDLAKLMNVTPELLYRDVPKVCKSIMKKVVEVRKEDGSWHYFNIMPNAYYRANKGEVELKINEEARPYLLELKELFTAYRLKNAIALTSKYSIRLYQITKSNLYRGEMIISLSDFKETLVLVQKSYQRFSNINLKVIQPAVKEINEKTDMHVECEFIKSGREVVALKFIMKKSDNAQQKVTQVKVVDKTSKSNVTVKQTKFNNFDGRTYDFDALEEMALGNAKYDPTKLYKG